MQKGDVGGFGTGTNAFKKSVIRPEGLKPHKCG